MDTPCGTETFPLELESPPNLKTVHEDEESPFIGVFVTMKVPTYHGTLVVDVDWRDAADEEVRIGKMRLEPGKGDRHDRGPADVYRVVRPGCADGRRILVGEREVARIDLPEHAHNAHAVIDPSAKHCYDRVLLSSRAVRPSVTQEKGAYAYVFADGLADLYWPFEECPLQSETASSCIYIVRWKACDSKPAGD
jgi:hypothetical protein